jgi:hypothetical protein
MVYKKPAPQILQVMNLQGELLQRHKTVFRSLVQIAFDSAFRSLTIHQAHSFMDWPRHLQRGIEMDNTLEDRIRERAYEIWSMTGRPDGQAEQHWLLAEREVLAIAMAKPPAATRAARRTPRSRATSTKPKGQAVA